MSRRFHVRMLAASCVVLAAIASTHALHAQPATPAPTRSPSTLRVMTLPEAVAFARAHQPQIRASLARVAARKAEAEVPRAQWLPTAGVTAQLFGATANNTTGTYVSPGSFMDIPRVGGTRSVRTGSWQPYPSTFVGAGATQELFDFGRIAAQAAASDAMVDVERQRASSSLLDVTFDVEEAYFAVFAAKAIVKASEDAYDRSQAHRDLAKAGVATGLRPPIELTRAEADLAHFDIGRIKARGSLTVAQTVLAATVGVEDEALDAAATPPTVSEMPALSAAIQRAVTQDPRMREAIARLKAQEETTRAVGAELRPDLSLTATLSGRAGGATPSGNGEIPTGDGWIPGVANWNIGAVLSWPLFDGTVNARKDASRAAEQVRHEEIAVVKHEQAALVREAYGAVEVARATLPGLERAVEAGRANYLQADARFKAGIATSIELADAEAIRTSAEIQLALGQFELARARAAFGRTIAEGL
jgi:outer membrane protein TolC